MTTAARLLEISGLTLRFGGITALADVSFAMTQSKTLGVIGPNGAGKTALLNCICGVYRPQAGSMTFDGIDIRGRRPEHISALGISRTFQGMDHFSEFRVADYVMLGRTYGLRRSVLASAVRWPASERREGAQRWVVSQILGECGLSAVADEPLNAIPYGLQKQVDVARVIASGCRLALLDEPTSGTTSAERTIISRSVQMLIEREIAVILIDHDVNFVSEHCDELLALSSGQQLVTGPTTDVFAHPAVREAFLGLTV
jgi:branched-chain amino acid transport system ATP-binding protein